MLPNDKTNYVTPPILYRITNNQTQSVNLRVEKDGRKQGGGGEYGKKKKTKFINWIVSI